MLLSTLFSVACSDFWCTIGCPRMYQNQVGGSRRQGRSGTFGPLPSFARFSSLRCSFPKPFICGIAQHDLACQGQFRGPSHRSSERIPQKRWAPERRGHPSGATVSST
jgi:hypothetical protein